MRIRNKATVKERVLRVLKRHAASGVRFSPAKVARDLGLCESTVSKYGARLKIRNKAIIEEGVLRELKRHAASGAPFSRVKVARDLGLCEQTVSKYSAAFIGKLATQMLSMDLRVARDFRRWQRCYTVFGSLLRYESQGQEIVRRHTRAHIEQLWKRSKAPTLTKLATAARVGHAISIEEIRRWSKDTGHVFNRQFDRKGRISKIKAAIAQELDRRRTIGECFTQHDVCVSLELPQQMVSRYWKGYIEAIADKLSSARVQTERDFAVWNREYGIFRRALCGNGRRPKLLEKFIRLHIERMHRQGLTPTFTDVRKSTGSNDPRIRKQLVQWSRETGIPIRQGSAWKQITLDMVLALVARDLKKLPLTFLESQKFGPPFTGRQLRLIFNMRQVQLRNTAFLVMAFANAKRGNDMSFFSTLSQMMSSLKIPDLQDLNIDSALVRYESGAIFPEHSRGKRGMWIQSYFRLLGRQDEYLRKLTKTQREVLAPYLLPRVSDDHFWRKSKLLKEEKVEREKRRKDDVAIVHSKFYEVRDIVDRRRVQIEHLNQAFEKAVQEARDGRRLPFSISFTEEAVRPGGASSIQVVHSFRLWDCLSLKAAHIANDAGTYYSSWRVASRLTEHPSTWPETYFLSYDGSCEKADPTVVHPYWFMERKPQFGGLNGVLPQASVPTSLRSWLDLLSRKLNLTFLPIDALNCTAMLAHAATQIMTKTGARVGEFLQIQLSPKHLCRMVLPDQTEVITFNAMPKGQKTPRPYYIDERCMNALHTWWKYQSARGNKFEPVGFSRLVEKIDSAPFLWQINNAHLDSDKVNLAICFMLCDVSFLRADVGEFKLTSHLLRHGFATEMRALETPIDILAMLLNQQDISVTDYYSKPTPTMLAQYQQRIFEVRLDLSRTHRRSPEQLRRQLEEAREKVAALSPVVGGTCTVPYACPSGYACLGCFGNAPDPKKREQVLEYQGHYKHMADLAKEGGLLHEHRKTKQIVANCDDILAEMANIEAVDRMSAAALSIKIID